jgi:hypothetical protein
MYQDVGSDVEVFILAAVCAETEKKERRERGKTTYYYQGVTRVNFIHYFKDSTKSP